MVEFLYHKSRNHQNLDFFWSFFELLKLIFINKSFYYVRDISEYKMSLEYTRMSLEFTSRLKNNIPFLGLYLELEL